MKNKIISSLILFVILTSCILPIITVEATVETRYSIDQLKSMYPTGMQWNDKYEGSSECHGFAGLIYSKYYGVSPFSYAEKITNVEQVEPGDMVRYNGHTVFVLTRNGESTTVVECNYDWQNHVRWDQPKSMSEFRNNFEYILKGPMVLGASPARPAIPTNVSVDTSNGVVINWNRVNSNCIGYRIEIYNSSGTKVKDFEVKKANSNTTKVFSLETDSYTVRVYSIGIYGESLGYGSASFSCNKEADGYVISPKKAIIAVGDYFTYQVSYTPQNSIAQSYFCELPSTDKTIVKIERDGTVTGLKEGTTNVGFIFQTSRTKLQAPYQVKVVTPLKLNETEKSLNVGETSKISVYSQSSEAKVSWSSTNSSVATVDDSGNIKALKAGTATITASQIIYNSDKSNYIINRDTCTVTIIDPNIYATSVSLNKTNINLSGIGKTEALIATILPNNVTNKTITWTTSNSSIATVSNGIVTAKGVGSCTITAQTSNGKKATCIVNVTVPTTAITLNKTNLSFTTDETRTGSITATVSPTNASKNIVWSSSNENVAKIESVSSNSLTAYIKQVGKGNCIITAKTTDGTNIEAYCRVTVAQKVSSISIENSNYTIAIGEKLKLNYTITPTDATAQDVTWSSSDESIVTVDKNGYVTGVKEGSARVTVVSNENSYVSSSCYVDVKGILSDEFSYKVLSDGTASIVKYNGNKTEVVIPSKIEGYTVTTLSSYIFGDYSKPNNTISSIKIPDTVTKIEGSAFGYCGKLKSITISKNVKTIGQNITTNCNSLESINVDKDNPNYISQDGILFQKSNNVAYVLQEYPKGKKDKTYILPNTVKSIGGWAIYGNDYIEELYISYDVTSVGYRSIYSNNNLSKVYVINSNTSFVDSSILDCGKVTIYGVSGSKSETYANNKNIPFVAINIKAEKITASENNITFNNTSSYKTINVTIEPATVTNRTLKYESENTKIATVDSYGRIKGVSGGSTKIYVKTTDGSNLTAVVNVTVDIKCTRLQGVYQKIEISEEYALEYAFNIFPSNASNKKLKYSIEDTSIATINENVIKPLKNGTTKIIAETTDGSNLKAEIPLIISGLQVKPIEIKVSSIRLSSTSVSLDVGKTHNLTTTITPSNATNKGVTWNSSNPSVADVSSSGTVTAKSAGTATITVTAKDGSGVKATCTVTVTKPVVTVPDTPVEEKLPFNDVPENSWFYEAVKYNYKNNIIKGYQDGTFKPGNNITRGQLVTILWRMENEPKINSNIPFSDVNNGAYYLDAIKWAAQKKIVNGYDDGTFRPDTQITRQQLAVMLCNFARYKGKNVESNKSIDSFKDGENVAGYATSSIKWAIENKVMSGKDQGTKIDPIGTASRCECAAMIYNYCTNVK